MKISEMLWEVICDMDNDKRDGWFSGIFNPEYGAIQKISAMIK